MRCFFTFALAVALALGTSAVSFAQAGGGGGGGAGAGGAGAGGAGAGAAGAAAGGGGAATNGGRAAGPNAAGAINAGPGVSGAGNAGGGATGTANAGVGANAGVPGPNGTVSGNVGTAVPGVNGAGGVQAGATGSGTNARVNGRINPNANARLSNKNSAFNQNYNGISRTPFFSDPNARQQLGMNNNQYNSLNQAYQNAYQRYSQGLNSLTPNLTQQQRDLQLQNLQSQFNQDISGTLNSTFSDPNMMSRYNQLNRQYMGFNAFNNPNVQQQLHLTPAQVRQLRTLSNNWRQQLQQFRQGAGNDLNSVDTGQWNQLWQQYSTQLNGVLTPEQQQLWSQQVGQPFTFSPTTYYGNDPNMLGTNSTGTVGTTQPTRPGLNSPANIVPKTFPNSSGTTQGTQQVVPRQATQQGTSTPSTSSGTTR